MRATFGLLGARALTSPYRVVAATYWFAAQALTAAFGIQAIVVAMGGGRPPLVPTSLAVAAFQAGLAVLGFDVMRWLLRVVLPLSVISVAVIVGLYLATDDPRYELDRVLDGPDQHATWVGLRDVRQRHVRLVAHARHQRGRPLPLHAHAAGHADRARLVGAPLGRGDDVRRRLRGRGERRHEPVRRREPADLERAPARRPAGSDRRPDAGRQPDERLHGRALAGQHGTAPRAVTRDHPRRRGGSDALRLPVVHRGGPDLGHAPREHRRAADGSHPGRLSGPATAADRRRRAVRSRRPLSLPEGHQPRGDRRGRLRRRPLLRGPAGLVEGGVGRRSGSRRLPRARRAR